MVPQVTNDSIPTERQAHASEDPGQWRSSSGVMPPVPVRLADMEVSDCQTFML